MKVGVVHVTATFVAGGSESYTWSLCRYLLDRGVECELWAGAVAKPRIQDPSIPLHTAPFTSRDRFPALIEGLPKLAERLSFARHVRDGLGAAGYDVLMIHKPYDLPLALHTRRISGCKTVWRFHGGAFHPGFGRLAQRIDAIYCVSDFARGSLLKRWPRLEAGVIHTGVDSCFFDSVATSEQPASGPPALLYFGRLVEWKGLTYLIDALASIRDRAWTARIVGEGPQGSDLEARLRSRGLSDRVTLLPAQDREGVRATIALSDIAVFPSVSGETFSNALLEAMSMGLAVVATRVGGFPEAVTDGRDGILVPPKSSGELAGAISRLLDDPAWRVEIGREARRTVEARFDSLASFAQVEGLLRRLAG